MLPAAVLYQLVIADRRQVFLGRGEGDAALRIQRGKAAGVERIAEHHLFLRDAGGAEGVKRRLCAGGEVGMAGIQRRVVGKRARRLQIIGHEVELVKQHADLFALHVVNQTHMRAKSGGEQAGFLVLSGQRVESGAQILEKEGEVFLIIGRGGDGGFVPAGILPVDIDAKETVTLHELKRGLHKTGAPFLCCRGLRKAVRTPAAHGQHGKNMRMAADERLVGVNCRPVVAGNGAAVDQAEGVVELIEKRRVFVAEDKPFAVKNILGGDEFTHAEASLFTRAPMAGRQGKRMNSV